MADAGFARFPVGLDPRAAEFRPFHPFDNYQILPPFVQPQIYYQFPNQQPQPYHQFTAPPLPPPPPAAYVSPELLSLPPASTTPSRTLLLSSVPHDVSESTVRRDLEVFGDVRAVQMERVARDGIVTVHFYDLRDAKEALVEIQDQHMQQQFRLRLHFEAVLTHNSISPFPANNFPPPSPPPARGLIAGRAVWAQFIFPVTHGMPHGHNQGTIIIFNLDSGVSPSCLREIFEPFGAIKELRETPLKKYQKFIEFYDTRNAAKALEEMNGKEICGKKVVIQFSRPGGYNKKFPRSTHNHHTWTNSPRPPPPPPPLPMPPSPRKTPGHSPPYRHHNYNPQAQMFPKKGNGKNSEMKRSLRDDQLESRMGSLSLSSGNGIVVSSSRKNGKKGNGTYSDASSTSSVKQYNTKGGGGSGGNSRLWKGYSRQVKDKFDPRFLISEEGIMLESNCMDSRTTVMIKNIPNKYSQKLLLNMLDNHCIHCNEQIGDGGGDEKQPLSSYDFVYLPIDFVNKCNVGYGFVNMTTPEATWRLYKAFHHQNWEVFNSRKICEVTYARLQGVEALKEHFKNSKFPSEAEEYMPVVFSPPRDGRTLTEPNAIVAVGRNINHHDHHRHSNSYSSSSPVNSEDLITDSPYLLQQNPINSDSSSNSINQIYDDDDGCGSFNSGGGGGDDGDD